MAPAEMVTAPRRRTSGRRRGRSHAVSFKWRAAPIGQPATDDDVRTTILLGAPGTAMPGFASVLGPAQLDDVLAIVRAFAPGAFGGIAQPIVLGQPPPPDPARGAALWLANGCAACHGVSADGRGPSSSALPAPPYDLTTGLHRPRAPGAEAYRAPPRRASRPA